MTRSWFLVFLLMPVVAGAAIAPIAPPVPLSSPNFTAAAEYQDGVKMAFNGAIGLAAWRDHRDGTDAVFGSRIDADGRALDPLGIRIATQTVDAVLLDRDGSFVVATRDAQGPLLTTVRTNGLVGESRRPDLRQKFPLNAAAASSNRILYTTTVQDVTTYAIVDASGLVIAKDRELPALDGGYAMFAQFVGAADATDFLLLDKASPRSGPGALKFVSIIISFDGEVRSVRDTGVVGQNLPMVLAGGATTFLLSITQEPPFRLAYTTYQLNTAGVFSGPTNTVQPEVPGEVLDSIESIASRGDDYLISWSRLVTGTIERHLVAQEVGSGTQRVLARLPAFVWPVSSYSVGGNWIIFTVVDASGVSDYDVFSNTMRPDGTVPGPQLLAGAASVQSQPDVAATTNGFAIAWSEQGVDKQHVILMRTMTADGVFHESGPFEVARTDALPYQSNTVLPSVRIAASGNNVFVVWSDGFTVKMRRYAIGQGWIDAGPISLDSVPFAATIDIAANDNGGVVVWQKNSTTITARGFTHNGDLLPATDVLSVFARDLAVATNGDGFLVAVAESFPCFFECYPIPARVLAQRLTNNAQPIGPVLTLTDANSIATGISVAWNQKYLVAWAAGDRTYGSSLSAEGDVIEKHTAIDMPEGAGHSDVEVTATSGGFVLLTRRTEADGKGEWLVSSFPATSRLADVAPVPRLSVTAVPTSPAGSLSAAAVGSNVLITFDRLDDEVGHVPRVFTQLFGDNGRRRAVRR